MTSSTSSTPWKIESQTIDPNTAYGFILAKIPRVEIWGNSLRLYVSAGHDTLVGFLEQHPIDEVTLQSRRVSEFHIIPPNGRNYIMEAYGYTLQFIIWLAWAVLVVVAPYVLYIAAAELYDAIRKGAASWSHIKAAFFMAAEFVLYKVTRAKNAGRHAKKVKMDDVNLVVFWHELKIEWQARPYSLARSNHIHA